MSRSQHLAALSLVTALLVPQTAFAEGSAYLAAEVWGPDDPFGHGIMIVSHREHFDDGSLLAELNTDTLTLRWDQQEGPFSLGIYGRGELFIAGLLPDYYVGGERIDDLGFDASYLEGGVDAKLSLGNSHIHGAFRGRLWEFGGETREDYLLPPDFFETETELGYTFWMLADDESWTQPHRWTFRRVDGFAAGARLLGNFRGDASDWGFGIRNTPEEHIVRLRQWAKLGIEYADGWRLQLSEEAGWGANEDDITRARVGGSNAYVVPIAGVPWTGFLASTYIAGRLSQHVRLFGDSELVLIVDAAAVEDIDRVGDEALGAVIGTGIGLDARFDAWQLDVIFGYSPDTGWQEVAAPLISGYIGAGYGW